MIIMWNRGSIPPALQDALNTVNPASAETAGDFHRHVGTCLKRAGFKVNREHPMPLGTRACRIDLHAHRPDTGHIWLELDRTTPRAKSILKLNKAIDTIGGSAVVVCRTPRQPRT